MKRARLGVFILIVLIAGLLVFRGAGRWLNREDPLAHADVIFVLGGGMPQRAAEAAKVYAGGYAPEVWLSRPDNPRPNWQNSEYALWEKKSTTARS